VQTGFTLPEILIGAALLALLVGIVAWIRQSRKPDSKMVFLLSLIKDLPKDGHNGNAGGGTSQESEPEEEVGPLGPSSFSLLALNDFDRNVSSSASLRRRYSDRPFPEASGCEQADSR